MRRWRWRDRPDWLVVVGDVNSTAACALVAAKLGIPIIHLEAGLRSRDRSMPEEINRIVTDALADVLWTPSADADENLLAEGVARTRITRVGNIMLDSFELVRPAIEAADVPGELGLERGGYGVVTLHRPSNVDEPAQLHPPRRRPDRGAGAACRWSSRSIRAPRKRLSATGLRHPAEARPASGWSSRCPMSAS